VRYHRLSRPGVHQFARPSPYCSVLTDLPVVMLNPFDFAQGRLREASGPSKRSRHRIGNGMRCPDPSLALRMTVIK
jgi:hypothetical protein